MKPNGSRLWQFKYRIGGKEKLLSIGPYPETSLAQARAKRDAARSMVANGVDPSEAKQEQKRQNQGQERLVKNSDVQYFTISAKDARVAHARRDVHYPTIGQCRHAFSLMPEVTPIDRRNKALFAFLMLSGARIGALASLRLKHVDIVACCVHQDAREVKTKASKTFTTWFFPVGDTYADFLRSWVEFLVQDMLFGPQDALFPKPTMGVVDGEFAVTGLSREIYQGTTQLRDVIGSAFDDAGLPRFHPHGFRKTLVALANEVCKTPEEFKAWSQNLGHDSVVTTISAYMPVSPSRQRDLIRGEGLA